MQNSLQRFINRKRVGETCVVVSKTRKGKKKKVAKKIAQWKANEDTATLMKGSKGYYVRFSDKSKITLPNCKSDTIALKKAEDALKMSLFEEGKNYVKVEIE